MDQLVWEGIGAAAISAVVAFGTTMLIRWLDGRRVRWLVTGEAHDIVGGPYKGRVRINLEVHNVGNGDAYDVRVRRCNGGTYPSWVTFERGKVAAGDSVHVMLAPGQEDWETAWIEVIFRTSHRVERSRPKTGPKVLARSVTGDKSPYPRHDDEAGRGQDLPEEAGGRLR